MITKRLHHGPIFEYSFIKNMQGIVNNANLLAHHKQMLQCLIRKRLRQTFLQKIKKQLPFKLFYRFCKKAVTTYSHT